MDLSTWNDDDVWTDADRWNETEFRLLELGVEGVTGLVEFQNEIWTDWAPSVLDDLIARGCVLIGAARDLEMDPPKSLGSDDARRIVRDPRAASPDAEAWATGTYVGFFATTRGCTEYERLAAARFGGG